MLKGHLTVDEETKKSRIKKAFTSRELANTSPEDMSDSTMLVLLNKYMGKDEENTSSSTVSEYSRTRPTDREQNIFARLLTKYEDKDNESPDTETAVK